MEELLDAFSTVLPVLVYLTWLYWVLGSVAYSLKFLWPEFDTFTNYGKLQPRALQSCHLPWWVENRLGFTAFYVFGFTWNLAVILLQVLLCWRHGWNLMSSLPFSAALQIQVTRRAYECLYVHKFSPNAMNLFQFVAGMSFYGAASFDVMELLAKPELDVFGSFHWYQALALALFLYCNYVQNSAHRALASLRDGAKIGTHEYYLPTGGWFEFVSSPHYTAEIVGYISLVCFTKGMVVSVWLSTMFVTLNISHSAFRTHRWYQRKFQDYPRSRRAVLPWVL